MLDKHIMPEQTFLQGSTFLYEIITHVDLQFSIALVLLTETRYIFGSHSCSVWMFFIMLIQEENDDPPKKWRLWQLRQQKESLKKLTMRDK